MSELNLSLVIETVHSIALSHDPRCECLICRTANGDDEARITLWEQLGQLITTRLDR